MEPGPRIRVEPSAHDLFGAGSAVKDVLRTLVTRPRTDPLERAYNAIAARGITAEAQVSAALAGVTLSTAFPGGNPLAAQLGLGARVIAAREALGT